MFTKFNIRTLLSVSALTTVGVLGFSVPTYAQDTTVVTLDISAGALVMYAGDSTDNNDLCETGNSSTGNLFLLDNGSTGSVSCTNAEQRISLSGLAVTSSRQNTTSTINDILFEDLSGSVDTTYSVSATISDFDNTSGGADIVLGANPDNAALETAADADAPTGGDAGKLYCVINPSVGTSAAIAPEAAKDGANTAKLASGAKATVISTSTQVGVFNTTSDVVAGRYDIDGVAYKCRIPAFVSAGSYTQNIVFDVVAS